MLINDNGVDTYYYYLFNLQGDIVGIMDSSGNTVTEYTYDAWGQLLTTTGNTELGNKNPLRYRGYYYDSETGFYYVSSRYYDPSTGSFIQKDTYSGEITSPASLNPYGYCQANPVYYSDPTGHWVETALDVVGLIADAYEFYKNPSLLNGIFLVWSVASLIPYVPGSYVGKGIKAVGNLGDAADFYRVGDFAVDSIDITFDTSRGLKNSLSSVDNIKEFVEDSTKYVDDFLEAGAKKTAKESAEKAYKKLVQTTKEVASELIQKINKNAKKVDTSAILNDLPSNQGFDTFKDFKKTFGTAGKGREWHHVVEQSQIKKSGFSPQSIHNSSNMISLDKATHRKITGYYNTKSFKFTEGLSVRDRLSTKSYEYQFNFGIEKLREFGAIK